MKAKNWIILIIGIVLAFSLVACDSGQKTGPNTAIDVEGTQDKRIQANTTDHSTDPTSAPDKPEASTETQKDVEEDMHLLIGDTAVSVAWEDNGSVEALIDLAKTGPLQIDMSMYGDFEQVGSLGTSLPRKDEQITAEAGDIVLYSGDQIVVFYGSNTWAYTRLGRITDKTAAEIADLLSNGNVTITISYGGQ